MSGEDQPVETRARWIESADGPLMTWCSALVGRRPTSGVLVLPPLGYQWWSTHRTLRTLAERLAAAGHLVARLDHHGTGDSAGDQWDPDRVAAWRAGVAVAVADLRAQGCSRVAVVGVRFGATLALLDGAALELDAVALWAPVVSGRRWAREIRMLAQEVPGDDGTVAAAGTVFSAQTLADAGALSALDADAPPARRVLIADARPDAKLAEHLSALGCAVQAREVDGGETALDTATEDATVPEAVVAAIAEFLGEAPTDPDPNPTPVVDASTAAALAWRDGTVEEHATRLGDVGLAAIVTTAPDVAPTGRTLLFLNTGSEPHVGPGRAWVEFARTLALEGHACVRADWRGWGESPDGGHAPGRPYDAHAIDDTIALVRALREGGHRHVTLVGLCASAWIALQAVLREPVDGVIALNPQMYWNFGDPVEATLAETRRRRTEEIAAIRAGADSGRWTAEDRSGARPREARWLDDLAATGVPTTLLFAEGDDGLEFLIDRHAARLAAAQVRGLVVRELPDIDHPMHRAWSRDVVAAAISGAVGTRRAAGHTPTASAAAAGL